MNARDDRVPGLDVVGRGWKRSRHRIVFQQRLSLSRPTARPQGVTPEDGADGVKGLAGPALFR